MEESVERLRERVKQLEAELNSTAACATAGPYRTKIDHMSAEVRDDNPYSRLMALQRMGIVENYEKIKRYVIYLSFVIYHN